MLHPGKDNGRLFLHVQIILYGFDPFDATGDFTRFINGHTGDKVDTLGRPAAQQGIVVVASVIDHDGSGIEMKLTSPPEI